MNRLTLLFAVSLLLALAAYIMAKRTPVLSAFLITISALLFLLTLGAAFGLVPWS